MSPSYFLMIFISWWDFGLHWLYPLQRGKTPSCKIGFLLDMILNCMDAATQVQNLDETDCISHSTNTLGKGINPIILPPAMSK